MRQAVVFAKIGKKVTALKVNAGFATEDLARRIDIARSTLWSIETGHSDPKLSTIIKIANYFKIELQDLFKL